MHPPSGFSLDHWLWVAGEASEKAKETLLWYPQGAPLTTVHMFITFHHPECHLKWAQVTEGVNHDKRTKIVSWQKCPTVILVTWGLITIKGQTLCLKVSLLWTLVRHRNLRGCCCWVNVSPQKMADLWLRSWLLSHKTINLTRVKWRRAGTDFLCATELNSDMEYHRPAAGITSGWSHHTGTRGGN